MSNITFSKSNLLRIPESTFQRMGGAQDPDSVTWTCNECGVITPRRFANGYLRGTCECQRKERERQERERNLQRQHEITLEHKRNQCAQCYTWLGENLDDLKEYSFSSYQREYFPEAYDKLLAFAEQEKIGMKNIIVSGGYGTGKTHLVAAVCNRLAERLIPCRFLTGQGLFDAIGRNIGDHHGYQHLIDSASCTPVLVVDDIDKIHIPERLRGSEENFQVKTFFNILNKRYVQKLPTLITTNAVDITTYIGGAAFSRLKQHGLFIEMEGDDYRNTMIELD